MCRVGPVYREASLATSGHGLVQGRRKVKISRLVIRRIGIGDVSCENLLPVGAHAQRRLLKRKRIVEFADHGLSGEKNT